VLSGFFVKLKRLTYYICHTRLYFVTIRIFLTRECGYLGDFFAPGKLDSFGWTKIFTKNLTWMGTLNSGRYTSVELTRKNMVYAGEFYSLCRSVERRFFFFCILKKRNSSVPLHSYIFDDWFQQFYIGYRWKNLKIYKC